MSYYDPEAREQIAALKIELDREVYALSVRLKAAIAANDELRVTIDVLRQMLVAAGQLDDKVLKCRIEAAIEEAREQRQRPRCSRCLQYRAPERMLMTEQGYVCDPSCEAVR